MKIMKIYCNFCGRELKKVNGVLLEDAVMIEKDWSYFSKKDGEHHSICLCESCYDELIKRFHIPVAITDRTEFV